MKFLVDQMLGKLARYLRFMGYDTYYTNRPVSDSELIEIAKREERIIITRDRAMARAVPGSIYIKPGSLKDQFSELTRKVSISSAAVLTRCSICNSVLEKVDRSTVKGMVPDYVYENNADFYFCSKCKKVYWYGSHTKKIIEEIGLLLREDR